MLHQASHSKPDEANSYIVDDNQWGEILCHFFHANPINGASGNAIYSIVQSLERKRPIAIRKIISITNQITEAHDMLITGISENYNNFIVYDASGQVTTISMEEITDETKYVQTFYTISKNAN